MWHDVLTWLAFGLATVALLLLLAAVFSPNARLRRRLRKTHNRIISKTDRPSVKFSVKTPPEDK